VRSRKRPSFHHKPPPKTDKLAATKAHEKEVHDALQSRREEEKARRQQGHALEGEANKFERDHEHPASKAAQADARREHQKEHRQERHAAAEEGAECEHGQKHCKICAPRHK
jgi:hypothetical protein